MSASTLAMLQALSALNPKVTQATPAGRVNTRTGGTAGGGAPGSPNMGSVFQALMKNQAGGAQPMQQPPPQMGPQPQQPQMGPPQAQQQSQMGGAMGQGQQQQQAQQPLTSAQQRLEEAELAMSNAQSYRFRPGSLMGLGEGIYDATKAKDAQKEYAEAREAVRQEQLDKAQAQLDLAKMSATQRGDAVGKAVEKAGGDPQMAQQYAVLAAQDPKIAAKIMEQIGTQMTREEDQGTNPMQNAKAMGMNPGTKEYNDYVKDATISRANVHQYGPQLAPGYRWVPGKENQEMEMVEGGPVHQKFLREQQQIRTRLVNDVYKVDNQLKQIDRSLEQAGKPGTTGFWGSMLANIPGTDAAAMKNMLMTQQAAAAFEALSEMRQQSVTGGALGNVSNREIELLYNSYTTMAQALPGEELEKSLIDLRDKFRRTQIALRNDDKLREMSDEEGFKFIDTELNKMKTKDFRKTRPKIAPKALEGLKNGTIDPVEFYEEFQFLPEGY